jgi:hypothetical protein
MQAGRTASPDEEAIMTARPIDAKCNPHASEKTMTARSSMLLVVVSFVAAASVGCVPPAALSSQGNAVQVSDENIVRSCKYLGDVSGNGYSVDTARDDARNHAAQLGATNVVFITQTELVVTGPKEPNTPASAMGRGYNCTAASGAPSPSAPQ